MKKQEYKKSVTVLWLFKTLKRNILAIISFTIIFFGCSYVALSSFVPKKYQTSAQLANKISISSTLLNTLNDAFKSDIVIERTINSLAENNITHSNGKNITKNDIISNYSLPSTNISSFVTVTFYGTDKTIMEKSLNTLLEKVIDYLQNDIKKSDYADLKIAKAATTPIDISKTKQKLAIFTLIAFVLAFTVSAIVDYRYDLVYDIDDVKDLNTNTMELNYTERKK